jgi:hypothetical protein
MAYREVSVIEVGEVLRAWLSGVGPRVVAATSRCQAQSDPILREAGFTRRRPVACRNRRVGTVIVRKAVSGAALGTKWLPPFAGVVGPIVEPRSIIPGSQDAMAIAAGKMVRSPWITSTAEQRGDAEPDP